MSNTMVGRHNVGKQRVNTGKQRSGQAEPASNKVKSFGSYSITPKAPVLNDAKETSLDLQKRIAGRAQQPFANKGGAATLPTPASPKGAKPGFGPKGVYSGKSGQTVTARALPGGKATGYSKLPNQSYQIGGRMGFPPPKRKAGAQNLSSVKRGSAFFGDN